MASPSVAKPGDVVTRAEAERRLRHELVEYERAVWSVPGRQRHAAAVRCPVSFAYNVGVKGMAGRRSSSANTRATTAAARHSACGTRRAATVAGLTRRRAAEAALYLTPEIVSTPLPVAEEVRNRRTDRMPRCGARAPDGAFRTKSTARPSRRRHRQLSPLWLKPPARLTT